MKTKFFRALDFKNNRDLSNTNTFKCPVAGTIIEIRCIKSSRHYVEQQKSLKLFGANGMFHRSGFTLIELLITISIVLVLTALALPSLQNAAVRARVARVRADLRTVATAVEMYTTDHNQPPRMRHWDFYSDPELDIFGGELMAANLSPVMTTPIAYLQSCDLADPFTNAEADIPFTERLYTYQVINVYTERNPASAFWRRAQAEFGTWRLGSIGPDKAFDHGFRNSAQLPYDATNGAISLGNLWRTQTARFDAQGLPPIPELLGVPSGR